MRADIPTKFFHTLSELRDFEIVGIAIHPDIPTRRNNDTVLSEYRTLLSEYRYVGITVRRNSGTAPYCSCCAMLRVKMS